MSNNRDRAARMAEAQEQIAAERMFYEVELSDLVAVKLVETTGVDEQIVLKQLGDKFKPTGYGAMLYRNAMVGRSVKFVRNRKRDEGADFESLHPAAAENFLNSLTSKEKSALEIAYSQVNELSDEEREKVKNTLTPTMMS